MVKLSRWEREGNVKEMGTMLSENDNCESENVLKYFKVHSHRTIAKTKPFLGVYQSAIYSGIGFPHKTVVSDVTFA